MSGDGGAVLVRGGGHASPRGCLAIMLLREFAVSGMRLVAVEEGRVIAAGWSGKVKTASTMVCICLILLGIPQVLNYVS